MFNRDDKQFGFVVILEAVKSVKKNVQEDNNYYNIIRAHRVQRFRERDRVAFLFA